MIVDGDHIDSFLLSCRVLGKGIEKAFMKELLTLLKEQGLVSVKAEYIPTSKNVQVKEFYEKCGFACLAEHADGVKEYEINLSECDTEIADYYNITIK